MCISATMLMAAASAGSVAAQLYGIDKQSKDNYQARLAADTAQSKADTTATQSANARLAMRRKALADNSLATADTSGMPAQGRATLGGG